MTRFEYVGFDQEKNIRTYRLDGITPGEPALHFVFSANLALFLRHSLNLQDGPDLCFRLVAGELERLGADRGGPFLRELNDEDVTAFLSTRKLVEFKKKRQRPQRENMETQPASPAVSSGTAAEIPFRRLL